MADDISGPLAQRLCVPCRGGVPPLSPDQARELFSMLAGHAATALFSSKLYSQSERKLTTIQSFLDLLKEK